MTEIREIALKREQKTHLFGGYTAASVGRETTACRTKVILIGMVPFLLVLAVPAACKFTVSWQLSPPR